MRETRRLRRAAPRRLAVLGAVALAGVAAAGCGGSGDASTAAADGDPRERFREAALEYAQCMRDEGIDMPDPEANGGGILMRRRAGDGGSEREDPAFREADEKCREILEDVRPPEMSEEQRKEFQDAALAFAQCMRREGIDMPDPQFDGDGRVQMRMGGGDGFDPSDPAFREAQEECRDELPMRGPGGPGGPGPGGPPPGGP